MFAEIAPEQAFTPIYSRAGNSSPPVMLGYQFPNITGTNSPYGLEPEYEELCIYEGAFYLSNDKGATNAANHVPQNVSAIKKIKFDASRITKIYSKSTTVQPPSFQVLIIIKT